MTPARISLKTIIAIFILFLLVISVSLTIFLVKQRQELRKKAAVPEGEATVSLSPTTGEHSVGESFSTNISFNTANIPISAIAVRITYPYSGTTPELTASGIQINPSLLSTGDWSCPVKTITPEEGTVKIDLSCINTNIAGFATSTDTLLASFTLIANQIPATNPPVLRFDSTQSIITRKSDGQDILLIPTSTGSYTITSGATPTPTPTPGEGTPTPTPGSGTPTPGPTPTPTSTPTPSPGVGGPEPTATPTPTGTPTPTATPTPTVSPEQLPEAGVITPTLISLILGIFVLTSGLLFLF